MHYGKDIAIYRLPGVSFSIHILYISSGIRAEAVTVILKDHVYEM